MIGLNNIREAYGQVYAPLDERMDPEERELRRAEVADRKASKMDPKVAAKYADSEAQSASRADKKSKGKHIHGMADSVEMDGDLVDEGVAGDVADRAQKLANQRKNQTPERKTTYQNLANKARERERGPHQRGDNRTGMTSSERERRRDAAAYHSDLHGDTKNTYGKGGVTKNPRKLAQQKARGQHEEQYDIKGKALGELGEVKDNSYLETDMNKRKKNNEKAVSDMKKTKAHADMVKAASRHFEEFTTEAKNKEGKEQGADGKACWKGYKFAGTKNGKDKCVKSEEFELDERALDTAEKGEKERLVKGMKKSAGDFKKRYGARAKSVMYATATKKAKEHMDTSKSDRRYAVEEVDTKHRTRKPSQIAKREKLTRLLDQIRAKKEKENSN